MIILTFGVMWPISYKHHAKHNVKKVSSVNNQASRPALPAARTPSSGPPSTIAPPNNETALMTQDDLMVAMATNVASLTSRTSMSVIIVGGVVRFFVSFFVQIFLLQQKDYFSVDFA